MHFSCVVGVSFKGPGSADTCCNSLIMDGHWKNTLTSEFEKWQPEMCSMTTYSETLLTKCATSRPIVVIGDSIARGLYNGIGSAGGFETDPNAGHQNSNWPKDGEPLVKFYWDPFLNETSFDEISKQDSIVVIAAGLWFMKHFEPIKGQFEFVKRVEALSNQFIASSSHSIMYLIPLSQVDESKLSSDRAMLRNVLVNQYNLALRSLYDTLIVNANNKPLYLANSVVKALSDSIGTSQDGVHGDLQSVSTVSQILLNHACNRQVFDETSQSKTTCCATYPNASWKQVLVMLALAVFGPLSAWLNNSKFKSHLSGYIPSDKNAVNISILFYALFFAYLADRTNLYVKYQKQFDPISFGILMLVTLFLGYATFEPGKDSSFLNRDITDEWKGWMQIVILIYHYTGASYISPIYNLMRWLVASYLFMTGYGHFMYFFKKSDYGLIRIVKTLVRLNLLTVGLVYVMNAPYQAYYFSPLVSCWFLIIWTVMRIGYSYNDRMLFLITKIGLTFLLCFVFTYSFGLFNSIMSFAEIIFGGEFDIKDWHFRFGLDLYIVLVGSLTALAFIKGSEVWKSISDDKRAFYTKAALISAFISLMWYFTFEAIEDKFSYNLYHPYISFIPILAFVCLRNGSNYLRSRTSGFYRFFGKISLETFILQFHIWLAMDTKGLLVTIPGAGVINFLITSFLFIYFSYHCSKATGELTEFIVPKDTDAVRNRVVGFIICAIIFNHLPPV